MKTIAELEQDILNITMSINKEFPELSEYINEMPITVSETENDVNAQNLKEYYDSLVDMVKKYDISHEGLNKKMDEVKLKFSGYPLYPPSEDIYNQGKKVMALNPNDLSKNKAPNEEAGSMNEKDFDEDMSGDDLDVPGSELDDQQESVGSEDEENNYYSLGGDNHNDLEEDKD
jgi:hypothetical protein